MKKYNEKLSFYSCTVANFEQYTLASFIEKGYFEKVITTNLNYHPEEIYERPYYVQANMSKYIASIIDFMNHDVSTENVQIPAEKIHEILNRYNNRLPLDEE